MSESSGGEQPPEADAGEKVGPSFSVRRALFASGAARLVVLPVTGVANLVIARLITDAVGIDEFGAVMLIATLSQLLVFADLGAGAAVATASAEAGLDSRHADRFRRTLLTAVRTMLGVATVLSVLAVTVGLLGGWSTLLGIGGTGNNSPVSANAAAVVALSAFGASLPFSLGEPVLRGSGRLPRAVLLAGVAAPTALVLTAVLYAMDAPVFAFALAIPLGALLGAICTAAGARTVIRAHLSGLARQVLRPRRFPGTAIASTAAPMFVVMIGLPLALQSDRIIISHRVSALGLSEYSYAAQLYNPLWSVVSVAALALWPVFAVRDERHGSVRKNWLRGVYLLGAAGAVFAVSFLLLAGPIIEWMSNGTATPELPLLASFAALLVVQSLHVGSGILLITPAQLRFQAVCVVALVLANLPLSWVLAPVLGPTGPVLASVVTVAACQLVPGVIAAHRATSDRGARSGSRSTTTVVP